MSTIRCTHVGSLIRPAELLAMQAAIQQGDAQEDEAYDAALKRHVAEVVRRQAEAGIDVVSDGEFGKSNWISYLYDRVSGIEARPLGPG